MSWPPRWPRAPWRPPCRTAGGGPVPSPLSVCPLSAPGRAACSCHALYKRTSGPSEQRSLLLPPPCNGTGITGCTCRQCADLQRKFCKFFKVGKFCKVLKVSCAPSAVLALECKDSSVVSKVFEMRRRFFPKLFENLRQNLGPSEKTKIADGGENRGKPHWILWWTTW